MVENAPKTEWLEPIYNEALCLHKPVKYEIFNKLKFSALILELFADLLNEHITLQIRTLAIVFKFRSKCITCWAFDIPSIDDRELFIEYMANQLNKL